MGDTMAIRVFKCSVCGKINLSKESLLKHSVAAHSKVENDDSNDGSKKKKSDITTPSASGPPGNNRGKSLKIETKTKKGTVKKKQNHSNALKKAREGKHSTKPETWKKKKKEATNQEMGIPEESPQAEAIETEETETTEEKVEIEETTEMPVNENNDVDTNNESQKKRKKNPKVRENDECSKTKRKSIGRSRKIKNVEDLGNINEMTFAPPESTEEVSHSEAMEDNSDPVAPFPIITSPETPTSNGNKKRGQGKHKRSSENDGNPTPKKRKKKEKVCNDAETSTSQDIIKDDNIDLPPLSPTSNSSSKDGSSTSTAKTLFNTSCSNVFEGSTTGLDTTDSESVNDSAIGQTPNEPLSSNEVSYALTTLNRPKRYGMKSLNIRNVSINLFSEPLNEITVSPLKNGQIEIAYTGLNNEKSGMDSSKESRYAEWRHETIDRFSKKRSQKKSNPDSMSSDDPVSLKIPRSYSQIFKVSIYKDDLHSILDVLTCQKLSTVVMDAFISQRVIAHNSKVNTVVKDEFQPASAVKAMSIQYLSLLFLPVVTREWTLSDLEPQSTYTPEGSLRNSVLIAPLYCCRHYYLAIFDFIRQTVHIYDSSWQFLPIEFRFHQVRNLLKILIREINPIDNQTGLESWSIFFEDKCAQQFDDYNCGPYVIYFVENYLKGKKYKSSENLTVNSIKQIRHDIVRELLPTTKVGKSLLDAITY